MVNIVTLPSGDKYVLDVGFGGDGATKPMPLVAGNVVHNMGTQDIRFIRDHIPQQTHRTEDTKLWIYQYRNAPDKDWSSFYAFAEFEFMQADFRVMNWFTGSSEESQQRWNALVIKFLRRRVEGGEGEEEVYGKRMLVNGDVKENVGGKTRIVQQCKTEAERVGALKRWFGITLTEEERKAIVGHSTELK
jgi:arylamine N-acetyltransferase